MKTIVAIGGYEYEAEEAHEFDTPLAIDRAIVDLAGKNKAKGNTKKKRWLEAGSTKPAPPFFG